MNRKLITVILSLFILATAVWQTDLWENLLDNISPAQAAGELTIDWGVPAAQPIFIVEKMLPGDIEARTINVTNNSTSTQPLAVKAIPVSETGNLSGKLSLTITNNNSLVYGPKSLSDFYTDSQPEDGVPLGEINPSESRSFTFEVLFDPQADNDFQGTQVVFDLQIGIQNPIPSQCQNIRFDKIIYGTEGNDRLKGTNNNDLIFGFEGNDRINGSNGNDCLVGGPGNDKLDGSNGQDVLLGEDGDDTLNGSNGDDLLFGGPGNDKLDGSNGDDLLDGEGDYDTADGGLGNDQCFAEKIKRCE